MSSMVNNCNPNPCIDKPQRRLCAIQMSYTDITELSETHNCIGLIKQSGLFDSVVIVAPDVPENSILKLLAKKNGIDIFFGSVMNVTERMLQTCLAYNCNIVLRVLYNWFFLDIDLVGRMLNLIERVGGDLLRLPYDFDIRFGGDVFTRRFLEKVIIEFDLNKGIQDKFMFNPWGYAECHPAHFDVITFEDVPVYEWDYFVKLRELVGKVWPERWDGAYSPAFAYNLPKRFLPKESTVLDLACGTGVGSACLADKFSHVVGADISKEVINAAIHDYQKKLDNLDFYQASYADLNFNYKFDAIVSIHTMEHIPDDNDFLGKCSKLLKDGGWLFLEVPLLVKRPFDSIPKPLNPHHIREYDSSALKRLVSNYFDIIESYGVNRGYYLELENARNAVLFVARKIK
ncbi:MAG: methyltransferase domain-containing protein [Deltaproteobacteria bacterium]|nr:methyltransferase domain-containing protein [Deltaproteobacteria bacterium]